jgi:hypothetical protein
MAKKPKRSPGEKIASPNSIRHQLVDKSGWTRVSSKTYGEKARSIDGVLRFDERGTWWHFKYLKVALEKVDRATKHGRRARDARLRSALSGNQLVEEMSDPAGPLGDVIHFPGLILLLRKKRFEVPDRLADFLKPNVLAGTPIDQLHDLADFLSPIESSPRPTCVWIPGIEGAVDEQLKTLGRLHGLIIEWNDYIQRAGSKWKRDQKAAEEKAKWKAKFMLVMPGAKAAVYSFRKHLEHTRSYIDAEKKTRYQMRRERSLIPRAWWALLFRELHNNPRIRPAELSALLVYTAGGPAVTSLLSGK